GSVGSLVVTRERAALFADSRYWSQAEAQIAGSGIQLEKTNSGASTQYIDWIAQQLQPGQVLAVDGQVLGLSLAQLLRAAMQRAGITLRTDLDLL
ncbi:aminopeptidase P family protein, partial [Escherichia coli]|uniref:aminopeptidase P family N-terminal domain-containing protein n=1 Tax=Escherichia coli TaxID=562 RepID=UPI001166C1EA